MTPLNRACRYRHLMLDLGQLLPHAKKDFKLDTKSDRGVINEVRVPRRWCMSLVHSLSCGVCMSRLLRWWRASVHTTNSVTPRLPSASLLWQARWA